MAALDPQNRSLATWVAGVVQPDTNDGAQTARWLMDLLDHVMERKASAILDFGGGNTALAKLAHDVPDLVAMLTEAGVVPVACYMVGPRVEDLASLEAPSGVRSPMSFPINCVSVLDGAGEASLADAPQP